MAAISMGMAASQYNSLSNAEKITLLEQKTQEAVAKFGGTASDWNLNNPLSGEFGNMLTMENRNITSTSTQTSGVLASPLPETTDGTLTGNTLTARQMLDAGWTAGQIGEAFRDGRTTQSQAFSALGALGFTGPIVQGILDGTAASTDPNSGLIGGTTQVGDPVPHTYSSILRAFSAKAITAAQAKTELAKLAGWTVEGAGIVIDRVAAGEDPLFSAPSAQPTAQATAQPRPVTPPTDTIPGGDQPFQEALDRQSAVGGRRGVFDALTNAFTSGLSGIGRSAVGRRFAPLEASFLTNEGLAGLGTGQGTTFETFLGGNPQALSPQALLGRLSDIGSRVNAGGNTSFLETFTGSEGDRGAANALARRLFTIGATTGIAPAFRGAQQSVLDREFDQFLFENPLDPLIGEIGRRGGRVFR